MSEVFHQSVGMKTAVAELHELRKSLEKDNEQNADQITDLSRRALKLAHKIYEDLYKDESIARPVIEILRVNIRAFSFTLEKVEQSPFTNTEDFREIASSFIQTFQVLIGSTKPGSRSQA